MRVVADSVFINRGPGLDQPPDTEALFGEEVDVLGESGGWAHVRLVTDGYEGYVPADKLSASLVGSATHRVRSLRTYVYPHPDFKGASERLISINSRLAVEESDERFARLAGDEGYVFVGDVCPLDFFEKDFVAVASRFLYTPYRWGGRTSLGLDCSALVQMSLMAVGYQAPRDSTPQRESVGTELPPPYDSSSLRRGDLVFWDGHVGILKSPETLLHSNWHFMRIVEEPLSEVAERIESVTGEGIKMVRRLT